ncbi:MAG: hypothetical protein ACYCPT_04095 [Acidimicrobiales bacterium]
MLSFVQILVISPSAGAAKSPSTRSGLLSLNLLSANKPQTLSTPTGNAFFTLYVPNRTVPVEFVASLLVRGPVTGGIITVTTPTNVYPLSVSKIEGITKFSAPLNEKDIVNGVVTIGVSVTVNLDSAYLNTGTCTSPDAVVVQVESATGELGGALATPTNPADFWPPILNKVVIWVPSLSSMSTSDAQDAALASIQVAATISQQYGTSTAVVVDEGRPPDQRLNPLIRNVVIEETPQSVTSQVSVASFGTAPVLIVSGHGSSLVAEAKAIGKGTLALATATRARNFSTSSPTYNPSLVTVQSNGTREITLAQLGSTTTLEGLGTVDQTQFLSQAEFGTSINSLQLRLQANYTPPPVGGVATFSVLVGGYIVASQRLGTSGSLSMSASVPASVLNRTQSVDFRLDYSPPGGFCHAGLVPVEVTINPSSGFAASAGQTLPLGFDRSPQDVASGLNVDLVSMTDQNLIDACELVTSLAQILPSLPNVNLVSPNAATNGLTTELIVGATRATTVQFHAPIILQPFRTLSSNGIKTGYSVDQPFAALEAFSQNGRDIILTGSYVQTSLTQRLLLTMNSPSFGGWFGLGTGQLAIMTADGKLRLVGSGAVLSQLTQLNPANNLGIPTWLLILIVVIVLAIVLRLLWFSIKMSRLKKRADVELKRREQRGSEFVPVDDDSQTRPSI